MDRNERARRRAAFGRPWEAVAQARSLAHGLEMEDEAEREEAEENPRPRRRTTGGFVAISAATAFVVFTIGLLVLLVDRYQAQAFMRDHGVATQAVITDKSYSEMPSKVRTRSYYLSYRFWPLSQAGRTAGSAVEGYEVVPPSQYGAASVGQTVIIRYNPRRLSQAMIYFRPPPTDRQIIIGDMLLFGVWVVLFGGLCAVIVGLAWPDPPARGGRSPQARAAR